MKSVLVGNGINIQFGGMAYTSSFIMKRIKFKAKMGDYKELFGDILTKNDILNIFKGFVDLSNDIVDNKYDKYIRNDDEKEALLDYKERYGKVSEPHEIMLEDWFFILHMFFIKNSDLEDDITSARQGFERLILDAIFNESEIQNLYKRMDKNVRRYFKKFDNIFTLNYDNNLENLTGKKVFHLHGSYSELHSSENPKYVIGYNRMISDDRVVMKGYEHSFCNALLDYSGELKIKKADLNHMLNIDSEQYKFRYENVVQWKEELIRIKDIKPIEYGSIMTKINNPELQMATEYYFEELRNIEGELHIIGMSPNNDNHIFEIIKKNNKIERVYFYYFSDDEKTHIEENFSNEIYKCRSIKQLWKDLSCEQKRYSCNYKIPDKVGPIINIANEMSGDKVSKKEIINEINRIPQFEMDRLCKLVKEDLKIRNPENRSTNVEEFLESNAGISYIALREGVLPASLYIICIMNWNSEGA